ncbi:MAG: hypothetical protein Q8R44_00320 [Novosphingobium sp.]|nr:hypothetical protein [Novosphingobium sp.]
MVEVPCIRLSHLSAPEKRALAIADNVRRYNKRQIKALKESIERFGIVRPVLVALDGTIVAGVGIWMAAKELKRPTIPVVYAGALSRDELRLYRLADQKLSTLGEYNEEALKLEFLELGEISLNLDLKLDLDHTGFLSRERDAIVLKDQREEAEPDENIEIPKVAVWRPRLSRRSSMATSPLV